MPKDILELGQYLVHELGLEGGVDTLGRWMAHHLAELITKAENGTTLTDRQKALEDATELILEIWKHRTSLPGNTYPLTRYKNLLEALDQLLLDRSFFIQLHGLSHVGTDQLAANLFDNLSSLLISLLLTRLPIDGISDEIGSTVYNALDETEKAILDYLQRWRQLIYSDKPQIRVVIKTEEESDNDLGYEHKATDLIDKIIATLNELRTRIEEISNDK